MVTKGYRIISWGYADFFFSFFFFFIFCLLLLRLRLSPSPPPTKVTVTRTSASASGHSHTSRLLHSGTAASSSRNSSGSKKRRLNDNDSETSSTVGATVTKTRISQHASASGRITVDEVDLEGKFVRLSNKADQVCLLKLWCQINILLHVMLWYSAEYPGFVYQYQVNLRTTYCWCFSLVRSYFTILVGGYSQS